MPRISSFRMLMLHFCIAITIFSEVQVNANAAGNKKSETDISMIETEFTTRKITKEDIEHQLELRVGSNVDAEFLKEKLRDAYREILELKGAVGYANEQIGGINKQIGRKDEKMKNLQSFVDVVDILLGTRERIEFLEIIIFPFWLFNCGLPRYLRWYLVLELKISPHAAALMEKLKENDVQPMDFGIMVARFYNLSKKIHSPYRAEPKQLEPQTEKEWAMLYQIAGVTDDFAKKSLKIIVQSLPQTPKADGDEPWTEDQPGEFKYFILLTGIDNKVEPSDVEQMFKNIDSDNDCKKPRVVKAIRDDGKYHGEVAVMFITKNTKLSQSNDIYTALRQQKLKGNKPLGGVYIYSNRNRFEDKPIDEITSAENDNKQ